MELILVAVQLFRYACQPATGGEPLIHPEGVVG